jgi:hypothetical protein
MTCTLARFNNDLITTSLKSSRPVLRCFEAKQPPHAIYHCARIAVLLLTQSQHNGNATAGAATGGATARRAVTFQTPVNTDTPDAAQQYQQQQQQQQHYSQQQSADASQQQHDEHNNDDAMLVQQQQEQQQAAADAQSLEELKALMELFHIMSKLCMYKLCKLHCIPVERSICCYATAVSLYCSTLPSVVQSNRDSFIKAY